MGGRYQAYPEYQDTEVEWLGDIPEHWALKKLKFFASVQPSNVDKKTKEGEQPVNLCNYTDVYYNDNVDESLEYMAATATEEQIEKFTLKAGDTIITKDSEDPTDIAIPTYVPNDLPGVVCGYHLAMIRPFDSTYGSFIKRVFECGYARAYFCTRSNGLTRYGLGTYPLSNVFYPIPPKEEARQIANFLDHETAKIDTLIDKQQQLIKLLKEKRQAVISHAVTKGLNPAAPMKDSGVEWLGKVPEHWVIISLGKITEDKCDGPFGSGLKSEHYTESGVLVVRLQNIKSGGYHEGEGAFIDENYYKYYLSNHDVVAGDVLIAGLGDPNNPVGRACVAPENIEPAMVKADCFRFRLNRKKVIPNFVARQLSVSAHVDAGRLSNGSTRARIPLNLMATRKVAICPLAEQGQILEHINALSEQYDKLEEAASKAVSLLQDRRTALISAAVTGKIDVRNWQPVG